MTLIEALIAEEGIIAITDGRAVNDDDSLHDDDQEKIFQISPSTVMMIAGGVNKDIGDWASWVAAMLAVSKIVDVTAAATHLHGGFTYNPNQGWVTSESTILIAGYDTSGSSYTMRLYAIQNQEGWKLFKLKNPYFAAGMHSIASELLNNNYEKTDKDINSLSSLALKAMRATANSKEYKKSVGGTIALWHVLPGQPIKKLTPKEIASL
jgi:20S proteasome alpha/beta subunit